MKFTNKRGNTSTIRKVWSDDKEVWYGLVGTVGDLLEAKILTYADYPAEAWAFIPGLGVMQKARFGATREDVISDLPQ